LRRAQETLGPCCTQHAALNATRNTQHSTHHMLFHYTLYAPLAIHVQSAGRHDMLLYDTNHAASYSVPQYLTLHVSHLLQPEVHGQDLQPPTRVWQVHLAAATRRPPSSQVSSPQRGDPKKGIRKRSPSSDLEVIPCLDPPFSVECWRKVTETRFAAFRAKTLEVLQPPKTRPGPPGPRKTSLHVSETELQLRVRPRTQGHRRGARAQAEAHAVKAFRRKHGHPESHPASRPRPRTRRGADRPRRPRGLHDAVEAAGTQQGLVEDLARRPPRRPRSEGFFELISGVSPRSAEPMLFLVRCVLCAVP